MCFFNLVLSEKSILLRTGSQPPSIRAGNWLSRHWHSTGCLFSGYNNCQLSTSFSSHGNNKGQLWRTALSVAFLWQSLYTHVWYWYFPYFPSKIKTTNAKRCHGGWGRVKTKGLHGILNLTTKPTPSEGGCQLRGTFFFFLFLKSSAASR